MPSAVNCNPQGRSASRFCVNLYAKEMSTKNKAFVLWLTGLSGSGKSTIAEKVYAQIVKNRRRVERLDGDVMRGLFPSTGFTKQGRDEHIKRVGFMTSRLEKHGVIVIASYFSLFMSYFTSIPSKCFSGICQKTEGLARFFGEECGKENGKEMKKSSDIQGDMYTTLSP